MEQQVLINEYIKAVTTEMVLNGPCTASALQEMVIKTVLDNRIQDKLIIDSMIESTLTRMMELCN